MAIIAKFDRFLRQYPTILLFSLHVLRFLKEKGCGGEKTFFKKFSLPHKIYNSSNFKSSCIRTAAAKLLGGSLFCKSVLDFSCALTIEYRANVSLENISKRDRSVGIKAARNNRAVAKNTEMVGKPVAEYPLAQRLIVGVGPFESLTVFKVKLVAYSRASRANRPLVAEIIVKKL